VDQSLSKHAEEQTKVSLSLLAMSLTTFVFIISANPKLLETSIFTMQILIAIPCLLASVLGRMKLAKTSDVRWEPFGYYYWIVGYACLINTIGIIVGFRFSQIGALLFFAANIIVPISYSWHASSIRPESLHERLRKDALFIALVIIFGLLPALNVLR
jgi:hypothetical protein